MRQALNSQTRRFSARAEGGALFEAVKAKHPASRTQTFGDMSHGFFSRGDLADAAVAGGALGMACPSVWGLAGLGLAGVIFLYGVLLLNAVLGWECFGLALSWPQVARG